MIVVYLEDIKGSIGCSVPLDDFRVSCPRRSTCRNSEVCEESNYFGGDCYSTFGSADEEDNSTLIRGRHEDEHTLIGGYHRLFPLRF